jgi:hypothetical protein
MQNFMLISNPLKKFFKREESQTKCYWDIVNVVLMIFTVFACLFKKKIQSFCLLL